MPRRTSSYQSWLRENLNDFHLAANYLNAARADSPDQGSEIGTIAFFDQRSLWEQVCVGVAWGVPVFVTRLKAITDLTPEQGACIASFEAVIKNAVAGDRQQDLVHKVKCWNKLDALHDLGEHLGLLEGTGEAPADVPAFTLPPDTTGVSVH